MKKPPETIKDSGGDFILYYKIALILKLEILINTLFKSIQTLLGLLLGPLGLDLFLDIYFYQCFY